MESSLSRTTLRNARSFTGIGLHSGRTVSATVSPGRLGQGIVFLRTDVALHQPMRARWDNVGRVDLCTTLGNPGSGTSIGTVEHLMATLSALQVDDAEVVVEGPELPILDGSAAVWSCGILEAGLIRRPGSRPVIELLHDVRVDDGLSWAKLVPGPEFSLECGIDFSHPAIGRSVFSCEVVPGRFASEIAPARTFALQSDIASMHARGLARGGSLDNAVVVGHDGVLNQEGLRFPDEFARHKALDAIGDLCLAGAPLQGRYVSHRAGHALNNRLLHALMSSPTAWRWYEHPGMSLAA
jgi:UDP-3-O-[3-hydroxymyristoyl] N-acetylglucosamine deacetylase